MAKRRSGKRGHKDPVYPEPSFIGNMGQQLAQIRDGVNSPGRPAKGTIASYWHLGSPLVLRGVKSVYVKPSYLKQSSTGNVGAGVQEWAGALSKYFGKPVVVGTDPDFEPDTKVNQLVVDVIGETHETMPTGGLALGAAYQGIRSRKPRAEIHLNMSEVEKYTSGNWAQVLHHEFGHVAGMGHPHTAPKGTTLNSVMSYEHPFGSTKEKLLPADINYYRNAMGYNQTPQSIIRRVDATSSSGLQGNAIPNAPWAQTEQYLFHEVLPMKKKGKSRGRGAKGVR